MTKSDSEFEYHTSCPSCGSSDALAVYSDGHAHCFVCQHYVHGDTEMPEPQPKQAKEFLTPNTEKSWLKRGLTWETCQKWGVGLDKYNGATVRVFQYRDAKGNLVGQKTRPKDKKGMRAINLKSDMLYGRHLWGQGGKMLVITEGEIDALSISQVQAHKYPVVSVPNGSSAAKSSLQANLEWISTFESVVLWFDDDEAGRQAVEECAPLFKPGTVKVASLHPYNDANEALLAKEFRGITGAIWQAKDWTPGGIVNAKDLWTELSSDTPIPSLTLPWTGINDALRGIRDTEVVTVIAGTGAGKSTFVRELATHWLGHGKKVGMLMLEETPAETAMDLIGHQLNTNLRYTDTPSATPGFKEAFDLTLGKGNLMLFDHFGSIGIDNVESRMRFMAKSANCDVLILDHISMMVSGMEGDERKMLDIITTRLKSLSMEIRKPIVCISHVSRGKDGKGHEEGGRVSMNQIRGTQGIGQLSNVVIGLERDQQAERNRNVVSLRILKGRRLGDTGVVQKLKFNKATGRLDEKFMAEEETFDDDY